MNNFAVFHLCRIYANHTLLGLALFKQVLSIRTGPKERRSKSVEVVSSVTVTFGRIPSPSVLGGG